MMLALATAGAVASVIPQPSTAPASVAAFDLARSQGTAAPRDRSAPSTPTPPRNLDLRDFAVDMPELIVPLSENGPRLLVGAFGGRGKGMPKLVHVGMGWTF